MRKVLLTTLIVIAFGFTNAQGKFEAKINPLGALFGKPDISAEYLVADSFGVELSAGIAFGKTGASVTSTLGTTEKATQSGFGAKLTAKYYFNPDEGCDGWYGGLYVRQETLNLSYSSAASVDNYKSNVFAGGVEFGKKWLFDSGFLIELSAGVGRPFSETRKYTNSSNSYSADFELGIDFTGKFAIGYRFL